MSSFALKAIALVAMLIDHAGDVWAHLIPESFLLRCVGRAAFPLYAFLIAEGCRHTGNIKNYMLRLGAFAAVSEIPFDLCFENKGYISLSSLTFFSFDYQNVFVNLFLAVLAIFIWERFGKARYKYAGALAFPVCMCLGELLKADYGWFAVAFIAALYFLKDKRLRAAAMVAGAAALYLPDYGYTAVILGNRVSFGLMTFISASVPAVLILFYNGRRGMERIKNETAAAAVKYSFYAAYPLHLLAYAAVNIFIR